MLVCISYKYRLIGERHIIKTNSPQHKMSTRYYNDILPNESSENEEWSDIELGKAPKNTPPTLYEELKAQTERFLSRNSQYYVRAERADKVYRREERIISERDDEQLGYHLVGFMIAMFFYYMLFRKK